MDIKDASKTDYDSITVDQFREKDLDFYRYGGNTDIAGKKEYHNQLVSGVPCEDQDLAAIFRQARQDLTDAGVGGVVTGALPTCADYASGCNINSSTGIDAATADMLAEVCPKTCGTCGTDSDKRDAALASMDVQVFTNWNKYYGCDLVKREADILSTTEAPKDPIKLRHKELIKKYWEETHPSSTWEGVEADYDTCYYDLNTLPNNGLDLSNFSQCVSNFMENKGDIFSNCDKFGFNADNYTLTYAATSAVPDATDATDANIQYMSNSDAAYPQDTNFLYGNPDIFPYENIGRNEARFGYDAFNICEGDRSDGDNNCHSGNFAYSQFTSYPFNVDKMVEEKQSNQSFPIPHETIGGQLQTHTEYILTSGWDIPLYRLWGDQLHTDTNNMIPDPTGEYTVDRREAGTPDSINITDPFNRMNVRTTFGGSSASSQFKPIVNNNMLWSTSPNTSNLYDLQDYQSHLVNFYSKLL